MIKEHSTRGESGRDEQSLVTFDFPMRRTVALSSR